jgi:cupin domain
MAKVSMDSAVHQEDYGVVLDRFTEVDGYTVSFVTFRQPTDGTPLLRGLPGDQCHCPHWGYVLKGRMTFRYGDRDEVLEAGDAFYAPPGHIPLTDADTDVLMFSPTEELKATDDAIKRNMQAHQPA